jgi:hypothetical protein
MTSLRTFFRLDLHVLHPVLDFVCARRGLTPATTGAELGREAAAGCGSSVTHLIPATMLSVSKLNMRGSGVDATA